MTQGTARQASTIRWPAEFAPDQVHIHVRNELEIAAAPEVVWAWLIRAARWPEWYPNAKNVSFLEGAPPDLGPGTRFRWWTFGVTIVSTVTEWEPAARLAWDARAFGVNAYHAWLIEPTKAGCRVITEETQHGLLVTLGKWMFPSRMYRLHQVWLANMKEKAEAGTPEES